LKRWSPRGFSKNKGVLWGSNEILMQKGQKNKPGHLKEKKGGRHSPMTGKKNAKVRLWREKKDLVWVCSGTVPLSKGGKGGDGEKVG